MPPQKRKAGNDAIDDALLPPPPTKRVRNAQVRDTHIPSGIDPFDPALLPLPPAMNARSTQVHGLHIPPGIDSWDTALLLPPPSSSAGSTQAQGMHTSSSPDVADDAEDTSEESPRRSRPKVPTQIDDHGQLQVLDDAGNWHDTVNHGDIRGALIARARPASGRGYDHPDPRGGGANDETAYLASQRTWGPTVGDRPHVLTVFECPWAAQDKRTKKKPHWLRHSNMVVVDRNNQPILDWEHLPLTLSLRGPKMEAGGAFQSFDKGEQGLRAGRQ